MPSIVTLGGKPCFDPAGLDDYCASVGLSSDLFLGKANSWKWTCDEDSGCGTLLMLRDDLDRLDLNAITHELIFDDGESPANKVTLKGISITRVECITPGLRDDAAGMYVVTVADRIERLRKIPCGSAYNWRDCSGSGFRSESLNGGSPWTWQQMVNDIADSMVSGLTITLPYTPDGTPENFVFHNDSAWHALHVVADRLGCTVIYNSMMEAFAMVEVGATDSTHTSDLAKIDAQRIFDSEQIGLRAPVPRKVRILFPFVPKPEDGGNPYDYLDRDAPTNFPTDSTTALQSKCWANTIQLLLGDLGSPEEGSADHSDRADERRDKFYQAYLDSAVNPLLRIYWGIRKSDGIIPGKRVKAISWYDRGDGWKTEVFRGLGICPAGWSSVVEGGEADVDRSMELCRVWFAAVTSGGIDYYASKFNELDAAGNTWDEGPIVGTTYDCFLVQRFDIALTVGSGSGGGCYLAKRDGETKTLTVDSVEYTLPVYVTTQYPTIDENCDVVN